MARYGIRLGGYICKREVAERPSRGRGWNVRRESCSCVVRSSCRSRRAASGIEEAQVPPKSGPGVHGCLGRCRWHRLTTGANAATEGTQGRALVAAKPRRPPSSLRKQPQGLRGCGVGTRARGREKARFDGRRLGSWTRKTFTGFRRNGLGSVGRSSQELHREKRVTHGESTGASEARLGRPREEENTSSSALPNPSQPALAS